MQFSKLGIFALIQSMVFFFVLSADAKPKSYAATRGNIKGQLIYRCNNKPANVRYYIVLFDDSGNPSNTVTRADSKGKFSFTGLKPGFYSLAYDDSYPSPYTVYMHTHATVEVSAGETSFVEINIQLCPDIKLLSPLAASAIDAGPLIFVWQDENSNNKKEYIVVLYNKMEVSTYLPPTSAFSSEYNGELKPGKYTWMVCDIYFSECSSKGAFEIRSHNPKTGGAKSSNITIKIKVKE